MVGISDLDPRKSRCLRKVLLNHTAVKLSVVSPSVEISFDQFSYGDAAAGADTIWFAGSWSRSVRLSHTKKESSKAGSTKAAHKETRQSTGSEGACDHKRWLRYPSGLSGEEMPAAGQSRPARQQPSALSLKHLQSEQPINIGPELQSTHTVA